MLSFQLKAIGKNAKAFMINSQPKAMDKNAKAFTLLVLNFFHFPQ